MKIRNKEIKYPDNWHFIYKISCNKNGKSYIGLTKNPHRRFEEHLTGNGSKPLLHDIVEYSIHSFTFEIIDILINKQKEEAEARERELILLHDCIRNGYNISLGSITANDDEIDINNIEIECKCVHDGVFTCSEHSNSLSYQLLTNLINRYNVQNIKKKKYYGYNYFEITFDEIQDEYIVNHTYDFVLKLQDNVLSY